MTWQQNLLETHTLVTLLIGIAAIALILTGDKTDALMLLTVLVGYALGASAHIVTATASRLLTNQTVKLSSASIAEDPTWLENWNSVDQRNLADEQFENSW